MDNRSASGGKRSWTVLVGTGTGLAVRVPPTRWAGTVTRWNGTGPLASPVAPDGWVHQVRLVVESVSWLRRLLAEPAASALVRRVVLRVSRWQSPRPSWSGRLGPLPGLRSHRVILPARGAGSVLVTVALGQAVPLREVLVAALTMLSPVRPLPRPVSADVTALMAAPTWLPANANHAVTAGALVANEEIRPYDVVLSGDPAVPATDPTLLGVGLVADALGVRVTDRRPTVLIDTATANPIGRHRHDGPDAPGASLSVTGDGMWQLAVAGKVLCAGAFGDLPLAAGHLDVARGVANIRCGELPGAAPRAEATLIAQLAATGAVLDVTALPASVGDLLAEPLREVITGPMPQATADPLEWEIRSVRQRRAALRGHAAAFGLGGAVAPDFPGLSAPPSVSAILVTRRPDYVADAVAYIAGQTYPDLEIVLCLHGIELDATLRDRLAGCGRPIEMFTVPGALSFGEVMGVATARARGSLVTKFDDDDVYGPEHVWDLVVAREFSGATLVGKAAEFVYLQALGVTVRRRAVSEQYRPPVAGGTMLMSRGDLEEIGGWRPVPRSVDRGLMDRVLRAGGLIYRTHPLGYLYERRTDGHTWDASLDYFLKGAAQQWRGFPRHAEFGTAGVDTDVAVPAE